MADYMSVNRLTDSQPVWRLLVSRPSGSVSAGKTFLFIHYEIFTGQEYTTLACTPDISQKCLNHTLQEL